MGHLRVFGCRVHVKTVGPHLKKLSDRSRKMVFFGYEEGTKGYRVYDPVEKKLHVSRDVIFEEELAWEWNSSSNSSQTDSELQQFTVYYPTTEADEAQLPDPPSAGSGWSPGSSSSLGETPAPQSAQGQHPPAVEFVSPLLAPDSDSEEDNGPVRYRTLNNLYDTTEEVQNYEYSGMCLLAAEEPENIDQALEDECWKKAMISELESIEENNTWYFCELPRGHKAIGLKWVYKVKKKSRRRNCQVQSKNCGKRVCTETGGGL